jgi:hypothetical protein
MSINVKDYSNKNIFIKWIGSGTFNLSYVGIKNFNITRNISNSIFIINGSQRVMYNLSTGKYSLNQNPRSCYLPPMNGRITNLSTSCLGRLPLKNITYIHLISNLWILNNTVTGKANINLSYFPPYSSYFPPDQTVCLQDLTGSRNQTVGAGKRIAIIAYPDATSCAEVYSMATTATPISYSCSAGRTDYQQSGTGDTVFTITNLGSDINVYKDGTLIEVTTAGTYTISDTSAYYFTPADGSIPETVVATSQTTNALVEMINKMPIIANVIIAVVIIGLLIGMLSGQINYNDKLIKTVFWILVIFGIIMAIGINLLSGLI